MANRSRPVRDLRTGAEYPSLAAAARATGNSPSSICRSCRSYAATSDGRRWRYLDAADAGRVAAGRKGRPVRCVETGVLYPSMSAAGRAVHVDTGCIRRAASSGGPCCGVRWELV